jgi:formylglycine-generating enzyme required for sulfatase activity
MAWHDKNSGRSTHPVGQKQANAWGLYDMHGNVWEWCLDAKKPFTSSAETDPVGVGRDRVLRGGGFFSKSSQCRSAFRFDWLPKLAVDDSGFRVIVLQYD